MACCNCLKKNNKIEFQIPIFAMPATFDLCDLIGAVVPNVYCLTFYGRLRLISYV